jgi:hypothetical protein
MESDPLRRRLDEAEANFSRALKRLVALRRAETYGSTRPEEIQHAVSVYCAAEAEVIGARELATGRGNAQAPAPAASSAAISPTSTVLSVPSGQTVSPEAEVGPTLEITPRLRFVKWLVETGRLTDG